MVGPGLEGSRLLVQAAVVRGGHLIYGPLKAASVMMARYVAYWRDATVIAACARARCETNPILQVRA